MMANLKLMQVVLQESTNVLRDKLKPEKILVCLQQNGVLDKDDVQKIMSEKTDAEKVIALLDQLRFKPEFKYALFMETLEQVDKQLHWKVKVIERKHNYNPPAAQHYGDSAEATNQTSDQSDLSGSQQSNEKEDILIQTFTKWANTQLKNVNEEMDNLEEDFWDGSKLTALIEVLLQKGQKEMDPVNQKTVMLTVMQQLFLSFTTFGSKADASQTMESKRDQLLSWVQEQIPDCKITNFTSDWTDGKAVGALVNKFAPGACRDWESWEEDYATRNIEEAMKMAEDWLQVAQVITASDMQSGKADEICVMAYLAQFCPCTETVVPIGPRKPVVNEINIGTTEMTVNWCHEPRPVIQPVYEYQVEYIAGAGRRAGRPAGHWKKHPDQIPNTIFTCTVKNLEHYQEYGFCVRGMHDGSKHGPISPLSDLAITTPNLDLRNIRYILMEATEKLCGFLDPYYVIENMYARRMLSFGDKQKIKSIQAFSDKVDVLLETLRRKEAKAYFVFMSALCKERNDLFREVVNIECDFTKAQKLHSKFSQPKALEVTKGDGPRKANVVHEPRKRPRPKGNESTAPGAVHKRTRYGNKGTASGANVPKRTQYDIKIKMDLQGGPVDHLKMIDTIFSQMLKPQILSNLVNNTFNPLGCTLVKFITIPAGSIQYSVQCADVIVLKDTFQSTEDSSLDKQLDRALLTKDVIGEEEGIKIKTTIDEAEFKQAEEKLVKLDLPGVPSTPNAVNIDKTSVKLTWSPPEGNQESGKFRVTAYVVEKCDISKGNWSQVNKKVCESSYAIKNLTQAISTNFVSVL
ncbi:uncharacterized protein [Amphiura filiformis]|uniref:uncharacterized protein n=1 Tax=Amphiura filiformis TaxID=82378 RepID=UPI003B20C58A